MCLVSLLIGQNDLIGLWRVFKKCSSNYLLDLILNNLQGKLSIPITEWQTREI